LVGNSSNSNGLILWITGVPGVGKTELSDKITRELSNFHAIDVIQLDGDLLRLILNRTEDALDKERKILGITYLRIAIMLAQQNQIVIVSTVAQYREIFDLIENSNLPIQVINLTCAKEIELSRNKARGINPNPGKSILNSLNESAEPIIFSEKTFHFQNDNLNDLDYISTELVDLILEYKRGHKQPPRKSIRTHIVNYGFIENFKSEYWNSYYTSSPELKPSTFAEFVIHNYVKPNSRIIDYGCGNGRDAFLFAQVCTTLGVDVSENAILANKKRSTETGKEKNLAFNLLSKESKLEKYFETFLPNIFYARFVFHALNEETESRILKLISQQLPLDGLLCAEMRTVNDPLYFKGIKISKNERIYGHYRRFIDAKDFLKKLRDLNFSILFSEESQGLSIVGDDNPVLLRVIAQQKS
jgi:SAM-dependent methyltransferase